MIEELKEILISKKMTISVAESCTSGNIQSILSSIEGSSSYFEGGITVYNISQKVKHLKINKKHAKKVNCVSERVSEEMAIGVSKLFKSRVSISTTGYIEKYMYYSILIDGNIITTEKLKLKKIGDRKEAQTYATLVIIMNLITLLKYHE